jgi:hypothetical protein
VLLVLGAAWKPRAMDAGRARPIPSSIALAMGCVTRLQLAFGAKPPGWPSKECLLIEQHIHALTRKAALTLNARLIQTSARMLYGCFVNDEIQTVFFCASS